MYDQSTLPDGRKIVDRSPGRGPHPHPAQNGRVVELTGVTEVMLADGTIRNVCDRCGKDFETGKSAASHSSTHTEGSWKPDYPRETLVRLIRTVNAQRARPGVGRNFCERATAELNAAGVMRLDGKPWSSKDVSRLYNHWKNRIKVPRERVVAATPSSTARRMTRRNSDVPGSRVRPVKLPELPAQGGVLDVVRTRLDALATALRELTETIDSAFVESLEVRRKAEKWDELMRNIQGG